MKNNCKNPDCEAYPYYGMAPHNHELSKTGHWIGSTVIKPEKEWPKNFTPSIEAKNQQGVWYCPDCLQGQEEEREYLTKEKLISYIVNRKIKYDRLLHGISPEGVKQLYSSVTKKIQNRQIALRERKLQRT